MMSISNQSYKLLSIPYFKESFDCIDEVMKELQIPYYLIGVSAIALELLKNGIKPSRGTKDIDFAVMVSKPDQYEKIGPALRARGFNKVAAPFTFYSPAFRVAVDLMPFGPIDEQIKPGVSDARLHLLGFKEVLEDTVNVLIEDKIARIPTLPGMTILKLIAWDDRPEDRTDDLTDILSIIKHYFDIRWDEIIGQHYDTLQNEPFDHLRIAAEVLGRNASIYLLKCQTISCRVRGILETQLQAAEKSTMARQWARLLDSDIRYSISLLNALYQGLAH